MNEFIAALGTIGENIWDLKKGLIMLGIILAFAGTAYYFGDFQGISRLNIVLTFIGYIALAFFNVHLVPYLAYKEAWKWNFLLLMLPVCVLGFCAIGFGFFYFPMSLILVGGLGTFIRLITYTSPIRLSR